MATLERAIAMTTEAHAGQINKGGQSYILHPLRVMLRVTTPFEQMAAVRRDVVEDTAITLEFLKQEGFAGEVISAVEALTKCLGESHMQCGPG